MALYFKTENKYQGYVPDVILPIIKEEKNYHWIITDVVTYYYDTIFGTENNLCLSTEELLINTQHEDIQLLWGVFTAVKEIPNNINDISVYDYDSNDYEIDYSDNPTLKNGIIEILFDDASGYLVKSQDKKIYEIYMAYYKNCKIY